MKETDILSTKVNVLFHQSLNYLCICHSLEVMACVRMARKKVKIKKHEIRAVIPIIQMKNHKLKGVKMIYLKSIDSKSGVQAYALLLSSALCILQT